MLSSSNLEDEAAAAEEDEDEGEAPFLWEQISASVDPVELDEVQRVVGSDLVSSLTDIYSEVRALQEIQREYSAGTDELVRKCSSMPRSTGSQPAGLVQLELKSLVAQLRKRAAANGVDEDALLPMPSSPQRKALESVLRDTDGASGAGAGASERSRTAYLGARPGTADSERLSLREMRLGSRPSTASHGSNACCSRPVTSSSGSRPVTAATGMGAAAADGGGSSSFACGGAAAMVGTAAGAPAPPRSPNGRGSRPGSSRSGRPGSARPPSSSGRPGSAASCCSSTGSAEVGDDEGGRRRRRDRPSRSGLVVSHLQAALEEEKQALLAQSEALRLSIDDEHDYRGRVAQPPPSLTSLLELKRSLQDVLSKTDHVASHASLREASSSMGSSARGRSGLSQYAPLPEVPQGRPGEEGE